MRILLALVLVACGTPPEAASVSPEPASPSTSTARPPAESAPLERVATEQPAAVVDLLHAVPATVRVSSVYRGSERYAGFLVDGDLETAWNSATGEHEGAWIELEVPSSARITAVELTAGFTRVSRGRDLFTGNHRVRRIRVRREGGPEATFELDLTSRTLQRFDFAAEGGRVRIELAALEPGSRPDWREACISELRLLGTAPDAQPDTRSPTFAVGPRADDHEVVHTAALPAAEPPDPGPPAQPSPHLGTRMAPGECPACFGVRDLPALSSDGRRIAAVVAVPSYTDLNAAWVEETVWDFVIVDASSGRVLETIHLLTQSDLMRSREAATDCCTGEEDENCDPDLCEPDEVLQAEVERDFEARVRARLHRAHQALGPGRWRPFVALAEGDGIDVPDPEVDQGGPMPSVRLVVREGATVRLDTRVPAPCPSCTEVELDAFRHPDAPLILVWLTLFNVEQDRAETRFFVPRRA